MKTMLYIIIAFVVVINTKVSAQKIQYETLNFLIEEEGITPKDDKAVIFILGDWIILRSNKEPDCFWIQNESGTGETYKLYENEVQVFDTVCGEFIKTDSLFIPPPSRVDIYQFDLETDLLKINKWSVKGRPLGKINDQVFLLKKRHYVFHIKIDAEKSVTIYLKKRLWGSFILEEIRTGFLPTINPETREKAINILLYALDKRE